MSGLRTAFTTRRLVRARRREERALARLEAAAPTVGSAHELRAMAARR